MIRISFRDPGGQLIVSGDRVLRKVNTAGEGDVDAFLSSAVARVCIEQRRIVGTRSVDLERIAPTLPEAFASGATRLLEHDKIFFPSYPFEWTPEMLHAAACLTIDLAHEFLYEGLGLKDATPYNVLFDGPRPVFVDVLSIERRDTCNPIWLPQAQFERTFLLPLLANRHFKLTLDQVFLRSREGLEPERVYALCSSIRRLSPPFFRAVTLPLWLGAWRGASTGRIHAAKPIKDQETATFILGYHFRGLKRLLRGYVSSTRMETSAWCGYESQNSYSPADSDMKDAFVRDALREYAPKTVLDVGCNTGRFGLMAARGGAKVVAIDIDPLVVGTLWRTAANERLDVLPLVVDVANPSPASGWRNAETVSFLERATGAFEATFMLAIVHHLVVTDRIPLQEIAGLAARLSMRLLLVEFVGREDPMFRLLCRGRLDLFQWYTRDAFESAFAEFFEIVRSVRLGETERVLYLLRRKARC